MSKVIKPEVKSKVKSKVKTKEFDDACLLYCIITQFPVGKIDWDRVAIDANERLGQPITSIPGRRLGHAARMRFLRMRKGKYGTKVRGRGKSGTPQINSTACLEAEQDTFQGQGDRAPERCGEPLTTHEKTHVQTKTNGEKLPTKPASSTQQTHRPTNTSISSTALTYSHIPTQHGVTQFAGADALLHDHITLTLHWEDWQISCAVLKLNLFVAQWKWKYKGPILPLERQQPPGGELGLVEAEDQGQCDVAADATSR
ncbi:hypothetical protein CEP51_014807, partial [Fusarium floridanum]